MWQKKFRILSQILLLSGALNIGLITTFAYFALTQAKRKPLEKPMAHVCSSPTNADTIKSFFTSSFDDLVFELENNTLLEDGYRVRDLALAYLASYHYLNLDQALSGFTYQRRMITFLHHEGGEKFNLMVYPGLVDLHFENIQSYIEREKWPFTPEGLFQEIVRQRFSIDRELKEAFYASPYFLSMYTLFARADKGVTQEEVLAMIMEGQWSDLEQFYCEQRKNPDLGDVQRQTLLHRYVLKPSKVASYLLIRLDPDYALKKISDKDLLCVIDLLTVKNYAATQFLKQLLVSVRSDDVRLSSARALYRLEGLEPHDPLDYKQALADFLPSMVSKQSPKAEFAHDPIQETIKHYLHEDLIIHVVKEGDSLWKIAKTYHVEIEKIRALNNLGSKDLLPLGKKLKIPKKS